MSGTPGFVGTRVPVRALLDDVDHGGTIAEFLGGFPTLTRERVIALLEQRKPW